jgi:hypothetical protein
MTPVFGSSANFSRRKKATTPRSTMESHEKISPVGGMGIDKLPPDQGALSPRRNEKR